MFKYSTPGGIVDISDATSHAAFLKKWHDFIYGEFKANIDVGDPTSMFFSEVITPAVGDPVPVHWNAFPLVLMRKNRNVHKNAWIEADVLGVSTNGSFRQQDEYCEWHAYTEAGKIKRIVFTAEGREYWEKLAQHDLATVVHLYKTLVSNDVQEADLLAHGVYNPRNLWNTEKGIIHLTHRANTLGAEINLASVAADPRVDANGKRVGDVRRLACCASFGDVNRSSDPNIGYFVNTTCLGVAAGATAQRATLADPVGLYIDRLLPGTLTGGPANVPVDDWFTFKRGHAGRGLMAILEPPAGAPFGLDQVKVKGVPLQWGGQVAEHIEMVLYAKVAPMPAGAPPPSALPCDSHCCMPAATAPTQIKDINLDHVARGEDCRPGAKDAYGELSMAGGLGMGGPAAFAAAPVAPKKTGGSRLATE